MKKLPICCYLDKGACGIYHGNNREAYFRFAQKKVHRGLCSHQEVVLSVINKIEMAAKHKGTVTGISTGFYDLDYKTGGLQPSDLILVAAVLLWERRHLS